MRKQVVPWIKMIEICGMIDDSKVSANYAIGGNYTTWWNMLLGRRLKRQTPNSIAKSEKETIFCRF